MGKLKLNLLWVATLALLGIGAIGTATQAGVILSEIMYDPQGADTNREWVEIFNNGTTAENIGGWQFGKPAVNQWAAALPVGTILNPGQALVLTPHAATFDSDWGSGINRLQVGGFPDLPNEPNNNAAHATLAIRNNAGVIQDQITYRDGSGWATTNGNDGNSIYVLPQYLTASGNDNGGNWRPASQGVYGAVWRGAGGASENHGSPGFVATTPQAPFAPSPDAVWSMVVIPDTQNYVARPNDYQRLVGQTNWVKNNQDAFNIQVVLQEGDIVNRNSGTAANGVTAVQQWQNARDAFAVLNGVVPYIMSTGNHDYGTTNSQTRDTKFNTYFKATDNPLVNPATGGILKGTMTPGELQNAYFEFTAPDGRDMLIFSLEFWARNNVVNWAKSVAQQAEYSDHTAVLLTHAYLNSGNGYWTAGSNAYPMEGGNDGQDLWNKLVKVAGNFEMTFSGHVGGDGVGYRNSQSDSGDAVHQMLLNSQFETNAGNGWMRILEFLEDGETVRVRTYSPHFGLQRTGGAHDYYITLSHVGSPLVWNTASASFTEGFARGNGQLGVGAESVSPWGASGKEKLIVANGGNATVSGSANRTIASIQVGSDQANAIIAGRNGNGTVTVSGSTNLTVSSTTGTGDLTVGEGGFTGTMNWNSSGTLTAQGRFRVGQGGNGEFNQNSGVVVAGNTAGALKFIAIGAGAGSLGTYNLNAGFFRPSGGFAGTEFRQTAVGDAGAMGALNVGDGIGDANSAAFESNDDLFVGRAGGMGLLQVRSDGRVELRTSSNPAAFLVGQSSVGIVVQTGGLVKTDNLVRIGSGSGSNGIYTISAGQLQTGVNGSGTFQIGHSGATGKLRVEGNGQVSHGAEMFIGDEAHASSNGILEIIGSSAQVEIGQLANSLGVSETIFWQADAAGIAPLVITGNGPLASNRVQLQNPSEVAANTGSGFDTQGDGIALGLDLSAITTSMSLLLIDNRTADAVTGLFENAATNQLYGEGEQILGTGFNGTVTISYVAGTGNDVMLSLIAAALAGDHNADGIVDAADFVLWRKTNANGMQGYFDWVHNFGKTAGDSGGAGSNSNVPEPAGFAMILFALTLGAATPFRRKRG